MACCGCSYVPKFSRMQALLESERISEGDKKPLERILREQDTQDDILNKHAI